ncbi:MAG: hypothetical protein KBG48_35390 [Kofleriaceae bacterium]|nr:hypothetical protein [Kofleriaceae bacterium]MBP9172698.1 hypothetical protein [Kofleriaceae bacterium]MBP9862469.1 hypothetical protein [Kofleriaceae bacterium]
MSELAFVLLREARLPEPAAVVAAAAAVGLRLRAGAVVDDAVGFTVAGGGSVHVSLVAARHPDAGKTALGPTAITATEALAAPAHLVLGARGLPGPVRARDAALAAVVAATIDHAPALAAMLGHGVIFHKAAWFRSLAASGAAAGALPAELAVDVTIARESETRMSFLSHGLVRHDREELYVTCPLRGAGAYEFVRDMVRWLYADPPKRPPTGATVGRSPTERLVIARVPNPSGRGPEVIKLELP